MNEPTRFCPICEQTMDDGVCPADAVPTVLRADVDEDGGVLQAGIMIANRYRIEALIARGGMGDVYRAVQTSMNRKVAVKTLLKDLQREPQLLKRFYREAKSASLLDHPNVVRIFDFGVDDETRVPYIAMEFLEGLTLTGLMRANGPFSEIRATGLLVGVGRALTAAHAKGLVHRDLKPENIQVQQLSDGEEHIKVFDFGIAKMKREPGDSQKSMTEAGVAIGTPQYMSPEQAMGRRIDHRADLYSLGCILYELVVGEPPFDGPEVMPILVDQSGTPPPDLPRMLPAGRAPSPALDALYAALMRKEPEKRPENAKVVTHALRAMARGEREVQTFRASAEITIPPRGTSEGFRVPVGLPTAANPTADTVAHPSVSEAMSQGTPSSGQPTVSALGQVTSPAPPPSMENFSAAPTVAAPSVETPAAPEPRASITVDVQSPTAPTSKAPLVVAFAILVVIGGVVVGSMNSQAPSIAPEAMEGAATTDLVPKAEAPMPRAAPSEIAPKPAPSAPTPTPQATLAVTVNSVPTGAAIFRGERRLGRTPLAIALPKTEFPIAVRLEKAGFTPTGITLETGHPSVTVTLPPMANAAVAPRKAAPKKAAPKKAAPKKAAPKKAPPPKKAASDKAAPKPPLPKPDEKVEVEAW
jgi:serine/threonine-protein kinase